ncbi:hypothetical protein Aperf_G00000126117 [Anoplocephala perfoliata]
MSGFSFGTPTTQAGAKPVMPSFGGFGSTQIPSSTAAPAPAFSFGTPTTNTVTTIASGFTFGSSVTSSANAPAATVAAQTAFNFPSFSSKSTTQSPLFGSVPTGASAATVAPSSGAQTSSPFGSFAPATTTSSAGGFAFNLSSKPAASTTAASTGLSFGTSSKGAVSIAGSSAFTFGLNQTQSSNAGAAPFTIPTASIAQTTSSGLIVSSTTTGPSSGALSLGAQKTEVASSVATSTNAASGTVSFSGLVKPVDTTAKTSAVATTTTAATSVSTSTGGIAQQLPATFTYRQLEEMVNKWTYELDEQSRSFGAELNRLNKADGVLIANADKISDLHAKVEACKAGQARIEQELEFVESQQRTLEDLLEQLEQAAADLPPSQQHADAEREAIFQMCINTDLELGQLLSELREMAERVNAVTAELEPRMESSSGLASSTASTSGSDGGIDKTGNVIGQVTRILNSHMHSLSWLSQNTQELMEKMKFLNTA